MSYKKGDIVELIKPKDVYRIIKKRPYGYDVRHIYTDIFECVSESEIRSNTIDEQTIMFWTLQLQFLLLNQSVLSMMYCDILRKDYYDNGVYGMCVEDLATQLALHLSGIEE